MSLVVWLPLINNIENQGNSNVTITNNGATSATGGKLGNCYYFNGSSHIRISIPTEMTTICNSSVCAWVNSQSNVVALGGISNDTNYANAMMTLYTTGWQFSGNGGYKYLSGGSIANSKVWHHVCCTFTSNGIITTYLDGVQVVTNTVSGLGVNVTALNPSANFIEIGCDHPGGDEYLTGYINDFRVYDHALSPREVKEISKGLIVHYSLDNPYIEASENLYSTLNGISTSCYNGATGKYGYGTNTDIYKVLGNYNGKDCMKIYMGTSGNNARPYIYFNNLFVSNGTNKEAYKTLSFDYYGTIGTNLWCYKLGSGSGTVVWKNTTIGKSGTYTNSGYTSVVPNQWQHISLTFHGTTDANSEWGYIVLGDQHVSDTSNYWLFANIMLEIKDHETGFLGYGESSSDSLVYDSSGYSNNAQLNGSFAVVEDAPRYSLSTKFVDNNSRIRVQFATSGFTNSYTFSWWGKYTNYTSHMMWGFGDGNRLNLYMSSGNFYWNTGDGANNPFNVSAATYGDNQWHHFAVTGDGTTAKLYIDGEFKANAKIYKGITGTVLFFNGWDTGTNYKFNGNLSDFRLYATPLSAEDILELYHTSASVSDNGTLFAYTFNEE